MLAKQFFEEATGKISAVIQDGPVKDIEKNIKIALQAAFAKLDLVTREEFDAQQRMIEHLCHEIAQLREILTKTRR